MSLKSCFTAHTRYLLDQISGIAKLLQNHFQIIRQMWEKDNSFDTPLFDKRSIQTGLNCIENYLQMTLLKRLKKQKMQF